MESILVAAALVASMPITPADMKLIHCSDLNAEARVAPPGAVLRIWGECTDVRMPQRRTEPLTVIAGTAMGRGAVIRGLQVWRVENLTWVGGIIEGLEGHAPTSAIGQRGIDLRYGGNVRFDRVLFRNAVRAASLNLTENVSITNSVFTNIRSDGINVVSVKHGRFENNQFSNFSPIPTRCTYPDGSVVERLSASGCRNSGGVWRDGDHSDGIQMWGENEDILVKNNRMRFPFDGWAQGINNFGGGKHIFRVQVIGNVVETDHSNGIVFTNCNDCVIRDNFIAKATDEAPWPVRLVINNGTVKACNNVTPDARQNQLVGVEPCPR
jgi:hypothetical protein